MHIWLVLKQVQSNDGPPFNTCYRVQFPKIKMNRLREKFDSVGFVFLAQKFIKSGTASEKSYKQI